MARVDVERLGGFAGFGGAGSRLQSRGAVDTMHLTDVDQKAIESLFAHPSASRAGADGFVYRLTRQTPSGPETIDVPEHEIPDALRAAVKDRIV